MGRCIALLRAINVGAANRVPMSELRATMTELGLKNVQTLMQSGNAVFDADDRPPRDLEELLGDALVKRVGVKTDFIIRTFTQWEAVIDANPFSREAQHDPAHLVILFTKEPSTADGVTAVRAIIRGREVVEVGAHHLFAVYPDGIGESKLTMTVIERALGTRGTARNWNTVLKLRDIARG